MKSKTAKAEFEINCDNGRICCRFLLGSEITKEYYYLNDMETLLKKYCATLHYEFEINKAGNDFDEIEHFLLLQTTAPSYLYRAGINSLRMTVMWQTIKYLGVTKFLKKCKKYGVLEDCIKALKPVLGTTTMHNSYILDHKEFYRDVTSVFLKYYDDETLCLKVLFT